MHAFVYEVGKYVNRQRRAGPIGLAMDGYFFCTELAAVVVVGLFFFLAFIPAAAAFTLQILTTVGELQAADGPFVQYFFCNVKRHVPT